MISVQGQIQIHKVGELIFVILDTHHLRVISAPAEFWFGVDKFTLIIANTVRFLKQNPIPRDMGKRLAVIADKEPFNLQSIIGHINRTNDFDLRAVVVPFHDLDLVITAAVAAR